jgi:tetratricopeptide (TPR) repeat protein
MIRIAVIGTLLMLAALPLYAQPRSPADSLFDVAQSAYEDGNYDGAELAALRGLREATNLDELGRLKFHLLLGFVYVARDQKQNALQEFTTVLKANPAYDLDPVQTSPKILEVFREARNDYLQRVASEPAVFRMPQADVRLSASWRSLLLPGWGQFYKRQELKGTAIAVTQVITLAALIFEQSEQARRHDEYQHLKQYGDPRIEQAYADFRNAYRVRNVVGYITLGVYIFNYFDALYYPVSHKK